MLGQVFLLGNLAQEPELRYTPSGVPVGHFNMAVNRRWKDESGESQERTVWVRVTVWRDLAENCTQFLAKGRQVLVMGDLEEPGAFLDKEGNARAGNEVTARRVIFLGGKENGSATGDAAPGDLPDFG